MPCAVAEACVEEVGAQRAVPFVARIAALADAALLVRGWLSFSLGARAPVCGAGPSSADAHPAGRRDGGLPVGTARRRPRREKRGHTQRTQDLLLRPFGSDEGTARSRRGSVGGVQCVAQCGEVLGGGESRGLLRWGQGAGKGRKQGQRPLPLPTAFPCSGQPVRTARQLTATEGHALRVGGVSGKAERTPTSSPPNYSPGASPHTSDSP